MRRPSLAGIFGLGQKNAKQDDPTTPAKSDEASSDWDQMDLDQPARTIRGTKRVKSKDSFPNSSKPSTTLRVRPRDPDSSPDKPTLQPPRSPRLFISFSDGLTSGPSSASPASPDVPKRRRLFSNTRSDDKHRPATETSLSPAALTHLALTPETIRPLLGHARDVGARLNECIGEVRGMMGGMSVI